MGCVSFPPSSENSKIGHFCLFFGGLHTRALPGEQDLPSALDLQLTKSSQSPPTHVSTHADLSRLQQRGAKKGRTQPTFPPCFMPQNPPARKGRLAARAQRPRDAHEPGEEAASFSLTRWGRAKPEVSSLAGIPGVWEAVQEIIPDGFTAAQQITTQLQPAAPGSLCAQGSLRLLSGPTASPSPHPWDGVPQTPPNPWAQTRGQPQPAEPLCATGTQHGAELPPSSQQRGPKSHRFAPKRRQGGEGGSLPSC